MKPFTISRIPKTFFGKGAFEKIFEIIKIEGFKSLLLVIGSRSFAASHHYQLLYNELDKLGIRVLEARVDGEPSPGIVDDITTKAKDAVVDLVLSIGGGSVVDTGKAVSAMIKTKGSVKGYLEGVGTLCHDGSKVPFIAVPTTSGTGSEATKNAVLSEVGENGFKRSLRHDNFIPDYAILDAELCLGCPPDITASSGMDALNQLIEGYMSRKSSPFTHALALSGIPNIINSLELTYQNPEHIELREKMSYASYLSGIVLANAGLGYVHGFAGVIGGMADIPHGVVCGKLNACIFEKIALQIVKERERYAREYEKLLVLGSALGYSEASKTIDNIIDKLYRMEENLKIPGLSSYGVTAEIVKKAVAMTKGKESPVEISQEKLLELVLSKL